MDGKFFVKRCIELQGFGKQIDKISDALDIDLWDSVLGHMFDCICDMIIESSELGDGDNVYDDFYFQLFEHGMETDEKQWEEFYRKHKLANIKGESVNG